MSSKVPFRILIVDDEVHKEVARDAWKTGTASLAAQHCEFIDEFLEEPDVELILAKDAALRDLFMLTQDGRREIETCDECTRKRASGEPEHEYGCEDPECLAHKLCLVPEHWLGQFHIIVLDLKGIGPLRKQTGDGLYTAIVSRLKAIQGMTDGLDAKPMLVQEEVQGVKFYHRYLDHFTSARAVIVLTGQDDTSLGNKDMTPEAVRLLLEPFCQDENHLGKGASLLPAAIPWTVKHGKTPGTGEYIARLIRNLYEDFTSGYEMLTNRGQIEFAAVTDHPVLILGESGIGKEYVANAIHRAWEREKNANARVERGYALLNCGGIADVDARASLFGAVRGSSASALAHLPGIILQACGCSMLGYESPRDEYDVRIRAALERVEDALKEFENLPEELDDTKYAKQARRVIGAVLELIYPYFDKTQRKRHGLQDSRISLPQLFKDVRVHLQNLLDGKDVAEQFRQKLLEHFEGRLVVNDNSSNPFDLKFKEEAGILGTLFLDELADLPPIAQSLLLRFLESGTQEIQPLGYPGSITGVRLRVIAATSDKSVATMAGVMDLKERAGDRPRPFEVRYDLLQRLRWHTIRVEPVNERNIEATIQSMTLCADKEVREEMAITAASNAVGSRNDRLVWDEGATKAIADYARERAQSAYFNQRRELRRIITMTTHHVIKGRRRGLRGFEDGKVTKEIVARFLTAPPHTPPVGLDEPRKEPEDQVVEECAKLLISISKVLTEHGVRTTLEAGINFRDQLVEAIKESADPGETAKAIRAQLERYTENKSRGLDSFHRKVLCRLIGHESSEKIDVKEAIRHYFNKTVPTKVARIPGK